MDSVRGQQKSFDFGVLLFQQSKLFLHGGIGICQKAFFLCGEPAQEIVVGNKFLIHIIGRIFSDHGCSHDAHFDPGFLSVVNDGSDILFVLIQGDSHISSGVPHIIDSAAQKEKVRFFAEHITFESGKHLIGLVTADTGSDGSGFHAVLIEDGDHQIDISSLPALPLNPMPSCLSQLQYQTP